MLAPRESAGDPLLVMKFWLIASGIYIWEFLTTLDFEWSIIRGPRRYRWTIWIYTLSRLSGLAVIILTMVEFFNTSPINCQAWVTTGWAFSALGGYGLGSVLIMIRIYAIWDRSRVIMVISAVIWVINLGFQLAGKLTSSNPCIAKIRAVWVPAAKSCAITNVEVCKDFYINLLATDIILLFIMLVGLVRLRLSAGGTLYISHLLWKQGVIWLAIATAAELPQVLLLFLNINDSLNLLFLLPSMVAIIIAATRTYRSLIKSAHPPQIPSTLTFILVIFSAKRWPHPPSNGPSPWYRILKIPPS
ncbi:hypothetical protein BGY98DRAFT_1175969 [Russula aff. rugulosa BPL654]|nr:hypothetical protein BGY98DRAFT_1175969 [Russula aff. rugulosa BPL654]